MLVDINVSDECMEKIKRESQQASIDKAIEVLLHDYFVLKKRFNDAERQNWEAEIIQSMQGDCNSAM